MFSTANRQREDAASGRTETCRAWVDWAATVILPSPALVTLTLSGSWLPLGSLTTRGSPSRLMANEISVLLFASPLGPFITMSVSVQSASITLPVGSVTR